MCTKEMSAKQSQIAGRSHNNYKELKMYSHHNVQSLFNKLPFIEILVKETHKFDVLVSLNIGFQTTK